MISLNLISPYQKKEIRLNRFYYLLKNNLGLIVIILILSSIVLLMARNILQENFNNVITDTSLIRQQIRGSNQKIMGINQKLTGVTNIQNQFVPWSNILIYLTKNIPPNIRINFLIIQPSLGKETEQWTIIIKGLAKSRDDFLYFQEQLKKSQLFEKVELPISNLTQKENIEFEFKTILPLKIIKEKTLK